MTRNEAREILMQIMYELEAGKCIEKETAVSLVEARLTGNHIERGTTLLSSIIDNLETVDNIINSYSKSWKTSRMPKVDLAILRLAVGEMNYAEDIPEAVSVNEAINLAKKFSTDHSSKFVHGVLGAISKNNG